MKRLDDSMPGIFEEAAKSLIKNEIKVGDTVASKAHPEIKSKIKEIKRSRFTDDMMYFCSNGCIYTRDEIIKIWKHD